MASKVGEAYLEITAKNANLKTKLAESERASKKFTKSMASQFKNLGRSIAQHFVITGADIGSVLKRISRESVHAAMRVDSLRRAFISLADGAAKAAHMQREVNDAFKGTVSEEQTLMMVNNALLLGVAKNAKEMRFLAEAGRRLGKAVGKDARFGFNSLIVGIGRQSRLMLDNVGIIVKSEQAYKTYAASLGKTVVQLTEAERKQAFMNATITATKEKLARLGPDIEDAADRYNKLKATLSDVSATIGKAAIYFTESWVKAIDITSRKFAEWVGLRDREAWQHLNLVRTQDEWFQNMHEREIERYRKEDEVRNRALKDFENWQKRKKEAVEKLNRDFLKIIGATRSAERQAVLKERDELLKTYKDIGIARELIEKNTQAKLVMLREKWRKEDVQHEREAEEKKSKARKRIVGANIVMGRARAEMFGMPSELLKTYPSMEERMIRPPEPVQSANRPRWMGAEQVWKEAMMAGIKDPKLEESKKHTKQFDDMNKVLERIREATEGAFSLE